MQQVMRLPNTEYIEGRVTFNFNAYDGTGIMPFTTFTEDSEKLLRMSASEVYKIKASGYYETFNDVLEMLRTSHFLIKIGPTTALSRSKVLQWCLKTVVIEYVAEDVEDGDNVVQAEDNA